MITFVQREATHDQFEQWDWFAALQPGAIVRARSRHGVGDLTGKWETWLRLVDDTDSHREDMWARLSDGRVTHYSWLTDNVFPPQVLDGDPWAEL